MTTPTREANAPRSAMISEEEVLVEISGLTTQIGTNDVVINWRGLHGTLMAAPCFTGSGISVKQVPETILPEIKTALPKLHSFLQDESKPKIHEEFCGNDTTALISGRVQSQYPNAADGNKFIKITKRRQKIFYGVLLIRLYFFLKIV